MEDLKSIGLKIKNARLSKNINMEFLARSCNITRATLSSIENGKANCSIETILKIFNNLGLSFSINSGDLKTKRYRATRQNTLLDKKINRFIIMSIEMYSDFKKLADYRVYDLFKKNGILDELKNDYEDLHGMSKDYLNEYIDDLLNGVSL